MKNMQAEWIQIQTWTHSVLHSPPKMKKINLKKNNSISNTQINVFKSNLKNVSFEHD